MKTIEKNYINGPYMDGSYDYTVKFPKGMTVIEFIAAVINEDPQSYAAFYYSTTDAKPVIASYKDTNLKVENEDLYTTLANKEITSIVANGWSAACCFDIRVAE